MSFQFLARLSLAAIFWPPITNAQVTLKEVQSLPPSELSRRVLGEAGSLMIEVDRSSSAESLDRLQFYGRAVVTGSQFGMCGADWVTVILENNQVESIQSQRRYGVEGPIYRKPGEWTYAESGEICGGVRTTRAYFPAPDAQSALEIALYVDAISGRGPFAKQNFSFRCTGVCDQGRAALRELELSKIDLAREIDCDRTNLKLPSCFELVVGEHQVGPFPKKFRVYGSNYMNNVVISVVKVWVGSTVE